MTRRGVPPAAGRGFTLIELLIAMALLGLITTILLAGFRLQTQHIERRAARAERAGRLVAVHAFVQAQLANAQPAVPVDGQGRAIAFSGRPHRLDFVGLPPQSAAQGGLHLISIAQEEGRLILRWHPFDGTLPLAPAGGSEAPPMVMLEGVDQAVFSYYGAGLNETRPRWQEDWAAMPYLPLLVRLELLVAGGERVPDLVVALRLAAPVGRRSGQAGTR
jgi:general secretion pathway protein J